MRLFRASSETLGVFLTRCLRQERHSGRGAAASPGHLELLNITTPLQSRTCSSGWAPALAGPALLLLLLLGSDSVRGGGQKHKASVAPARLLANLSPHDVGVRL